MSQGNNPFENLSSQSIPQPILSSNVRPSTSSQPQQQHQQQQQPPTPRSFAPIAPDPVGLQRMQAVRQSQETEETQQTKKRRLTQSSMEAPAPPPLKDEDKLLLQLKDEQQLPWKNIVSRFQQETGKVHHIAALQMRYKRLKDRLQVWTDPDIEALKQAHEYWESRKFDIISAKVRSHAPMAGLYSQVSFFAATATTVALEYHQKVCMTGLANSLLYRCSNLVLQRNSPPLLVGENGKSFIRRLSTASTNSL